MESNLSKIFSYFSIFEGIDTTELDKLAAQGADIYYKKGQVINREGDYPPAFYLILEGMVKVSKVSSKGKEFTIDWRYPGETLGWGQVIRGGFFNATYTTLADTVIVSFNKKNFKEFLTRNPSVLARIADLDIDLINKLFNKLIDVATKTTNIRLTGTLSSLCEKAGNIINLTHSEVAQMAWTTVETTTRTLSKLKKDKIISTKRGSIIIHKPEKLF